MIGPGLEAALRRWRLTLEAPPARTDSGTVAMVRCGEERLLLKLPRVEDELRAWRVLAHWRGEGAVRVLAHARDGAVLLERALPGDALTGRVLAGDDDGAMAVVCEVAGALHRQPPPRGRFERVEDWGLGFQRHRASGRGGIAQKMLERAERMFAVLAQTQGRRRLLHGDLHHDNILFDAARGWLAIDPKGVLGEPAYEFGAALRNPGEDASRFADADILQRRALIIAREMGCDSGRVLGWAFAQAVLSAVWSIEDGRDPARGRATAEAALPLVAAT
jgi:streptomycin 6-kinase